MKVGEVITFVYSSLFYLDPAVRTRHDIFPRFHANN